MKKKLLLVAAASVGLGACAHSPYGYGYDRYGYDDRRSGSGAVEGAVIGAVAGAVVGSVVDGISTTEGAVAGAAVGAVAGAVAEDRRYRRDSRGDCYYVDRDGYPVYDYDARC